MNQEAIKNLILAMADDALIIGHRNSEWTGIGPLLEEDLAFSSMAQDKIGHAQALYDILHQHFGMPDADHLGFMRKENDFRCCQLVELPIGEYDFSLMRHFLASHADVIRCQMLEQSAFEPLAQFARKVRGELRYHTFHADVFVKQLSMGTEESKARMQQALNYCLPFALGMFEVVETEKTLIEEQVFAGEVSLQQQWIAKVQPMLESFGLTWPSVDAAKVMNGGRKGFHTEYLKPLLDEMCEVVRTDEIAEW